MGGTRGGETTFCVEVYQHTEVNSWGGGASGGETTVYVEALLAPRG